MEALKVKEMMKREVPQVKTIKIEPACMRYGVGRNTMRKIAEDAGAVVRIGKSYLINVSKVDKYMDSLSGNEWMSEVFKENDRMEVRRWILMKLYRW